MPLESQVDVSVVIPAYNGAETIGDCLASVTRALGSRRGEIVVVDSSSDATPDLVRERFPSVRLWHSETRLSAGEARNRGIAHARGAIVAFTDQDCVVPGDWLDRLLAHFADAGIGGVGGVVGIADFDNYAGSALYFLEFFHHLPSAGPARPESDFLVGCNAAYRRSVLAEVRFPDQTLAEDVLLGHRLRGRGIRTIRDPAIEVRHRNKRGWRVFLAYNYEMGRAAAAYHTTLRQRRALAFLRFPSLAFALPMLVLPAIGLRLLRSRRRSYLGRFVLLAPACLLGNLYWAAGFRRQARSDDPAAFRLAGADSRRAAPPHPDPTAGRSRAR